MPSSPGLIAFYDRGRGLVAGRFDAQHDHRLAIPAETRPYVDVRQGPFGGGPALALRGLMAQSASSAHLLRIGTRGSPLAMAQAHTVRDRLAAAHGCAPDDIDIHVIKTTGDQILDRPLSEAGGKGLFTKEIEEALLADTIDIAVHSSKDMPTALPDGLALVAYLEREDVRDVFISRKAATIADLPAGALVGSASLRRQALVKRLRPDLRVEVFRGNVQSSACVNSTRARSTRHCLRSPA